MDHSEEQASIFELVYRITHGELHKSEMVEAALSDFFVANRTKEEIAATIGALITELNVPQPHWGRSNGDERGAGQALGLIRSAGGPPLFIRPDGVYSEKYYYR